MSLVASPLSEACTLLSEGRIFLFGSILSDSSKIDDVDVLVVYSPTEDISTLKAHLCELGSRIPLDVTYMTIYEEERFQFVMQQGAVPVHHLWPNPSFNTDWRDKTAPAGEFKRYV